jgi:aspartate carbamoyltransferase catalytic subunit
MTIRLLQTKGESLDHEIQTLISLGVESLVIRTSKNNIEEYRKFEKHLNYKCWFW